MTALPLTRLEILGELNVTRCPCRDCLWAKADALADALEAGNVLAVNDGGDVITSLAITASGRARMQPVLPWSTA